MTAPAMVQRRPAKIPGETVAIPTFIASHVVPQTKQMKTNIARCDAVDEAFIWVAEVLLADRNGSASGGTIAAPKRHGAYASGGFGAGEAGETERRGIDHGAIASDQVGHQAAGSGADGEAVAGGAG